MTIELTVAEASIIYSIARSALVTLDEPTDPESREARLVATAAVDILGDTLPTKVREFIEDSLDAAQNRN